MDFIQDGWGAVFNLNETVRSEKRAIGYVNVKYVSTVEEVAKKKDTPSAPVKTKPAPATVKGEGEVKAPVAATPQPDPIRVGVDPSRMPVKISSDRMTYDETGKVVSFVGNVVAEHGELTLWSEKLSAFFASKSNKQFSADSVDRIVAEGNVRVKKGTTEGTCGKLTYLVGKQLLKMENNPLLQDGPNSLTGEVIKFHVRENRSEVVGGKGKRVKAVFMTPENMKRQ
ncbi:LptA/OstA family protein [uncultured Pseudodesulfovibrio sp.]|uniref:LptA/OstA family protein n=1 Tax=uncultured Pseudodesulfovibrio sp. TaxID=2035858 RepID=UPI0029C6A085|nr:LptA/OstA family protein [uncultured Pseudodesulfovibrio sp.]